MKNVMFYFLDNDIIIDGLSVVEQLVCEIVVECWCSGKCVFIVCEDEKQVYWLDEVLWVCLVESFVLYNLVGEGLCGGVLVEIVWL